MANNSRAEMALMHSSGGDCDGAGISYCAPCAPPCLGARALGRGGCVSVLLGDDALTHHKEVGCGTVMGVLAGSPDPESERCLR